MAEVLQFEVISDLSSLVPQKIDTNFEAVKSGLAATIQPYTTLVVTEGGIGDAKKTLAQLRKLKDGINAQKIAVKKEWMRPYTEFEDQAKQLMGLVDGGITNIDGQIKAYDEERRAAKLRTLKEAFSEAVGLRGIEAYLRWDQVFNPKWLNATCPTDAAFDDIAEAVSKTEEDLDFLRGLHSEYEAAILDEYSRNHDLKSAMNTANRLKAIQQAEDDARAQDCVYRENARPETENAPTCPPAPPAREIEATDRCIRPMAEPQGPKIYTFCFEMQMTAEQARALKDFLDAQNIKYRKL